MFEEARLANVRGGCFLGVSPLSSSMSASNRPKVCCTCHKMREQSPTLRSFSISINDRPSRKAFRDTDKDLYNSVNRRAKCCLLTIPANHQASRRDAYWNTLVILSRPSNVNASAVHDFNESGVAFFFRPVMMKEGDCVGDDGDMVEGVELSSCFGKKMMATIHQCAFRWHDAIDATNFFPGRG